MWIARPPRFSAAEEFLAGRHVPGVDIFEPRRLGIDSLAGSAAWARRDAERADVAWWTLGDEITAPVAAHWGAPPSDPVLRIRAAVAAVVDRDFFADLAISDSGTAASLASEKRFRAAAGRWAADGRRLLRMDWDFAAWWADMPEEAGDLEVDLAAEEETDREVERIRAEVAQARAALAAATAAVEKLAAYEVKLEKAGGPIDRRGEHYVARRLAVAWEAILGAAPPRSKAGPFVRFCSGAWTDMGLPTVGDVAGAFGSIAEKLPRTGGARK
ncbi:hypothetical protein V5F29_18655 [Xanthobacter aminoxidans]|uniref:hypothetical protein n=1 Tax=Xanthobacter aminoxidans TaxID=186280 RepID=UPI00372796C2